MSVLPLSKTVIITPSPNSGSFFRANDRSVTKAEESFYGKNSNGDERLIESIPYNLQRFSGTKQIKRIKYRWHKKRWLLIDPEDITKTKELTKNSEYLDELVVKCNLTVDNRSRADFGKPITKANIFDRNDPFFTHAKLRITLDTGEAVINIDNQNPTEGLVVLGLMTQKEFQVGSHSNKGIITGVRTRYLILDSDIEQKGKSETRKLDKEARKYYDKLSDKQKAKVGMALSIINSPNLEAEVIDNQFYDYITDGITILPKLNVTKQEHFVVNMRKGATHINAMYVFKLAKSTGILKYRDRMWRAFDEIIGDNEETAIAFLSADENAEMLDRIEQAALKINE